MTRKSKGFRQGSRFKLQSRKRVTINQHLQEFKEGDKVHIDMEPSIHNFPNPRFQGLTGEILGKRGRSYWVRVRTGNAIKKLIIQPVHLKKANIK